MTPTSVWPQVEPLLTRVERPSRYLDREWGARHRDDASYRAVLVYPDTYEIGQANQALQILYAILNEIDDVAAERAYVPWIDMSAEMRAEGIPLFALESAAPVRDFDIVGFTLPYEMTYTNILEALDLAGIPLRAAERGDSDPLVIAGGPCAFNPEPVAAFFDAIVIGEAEEAIVDLVRTHREAIVAGLDREATLLELAQVAGVYVPSLYDVCRDADGDFAGVSAEDPAPAVVLKRVVSDFGEGRPLSCPVVPFMDVVHDRLAVEVLRGCTRGCRFCQAGMIYRPVRERSADEVVREVMAGLACTGYDEISLTSLSSTDHSQIEDILRRLKRRLSESGVSVSLPSLRVDSFGVDMARLVAAGKKSGLTFAPEAGTQRLRDVVNKNVTEEDLLTTVRRAFEAGWRRVKLYFMIGLPTETDDDIRGIGDLVQAVLNEARSATPADARGSVRVAVSVSTFVPKAHTPFQWEPQIPLDEVVRRQELLRSLVPRKGVDLSWHDAEGSFLEGAFARGGRELADVIEAAWRDGARFDAWTEQFDPRRWYEAFASCGIDPAAIASSIRSPGEPLPWGHISSGVSEAYLSRERESALTGTPTPDCSFDGCTGCDVCGDLGVTVLLGGDRRA